MKHTLVVYKTYPVCLFVCLHVFHDSAVFFMSCQMCMEEYIHCLLPSKRHNWNLIVSYLNPFLRDWSWYLFYWSQNFNWNSLCLHNVCKLRACFQVEIFLLNRHFFPDYSGPLIGLIVCCGFNLSHIRFWNWYSDEVTASIPSMLHRDWVTAG